MILHPPLPAVDLDGNLVISGFTSSDDIEEAISEGWEYNGGANDGFLYIVSKEGEIISSRYFGGNGSDYPSAMVTDSEGNTYISG